MTSKLIKISDELYEQISSVAEKQGKTIKEVVEEALQQYLGVLQGVSKDEDVEDVKTVEDWRLLFDSKCEICKGDIKAGEHAVRVIITLKDGRKVNKFYHKECYLFHSDKLMAKYYVKKRQLQRIIKALEAQCNEYADRILEIEDKVKLAELQERFQHVLKLVEDYLTEFKDEQLKQIHEEIKKLKQDIEELRLALTMKIRRAMKTREAYTEP
ncbi:MAG: ribbon-helix-helix protein, CopG family [Candidatus Nezhaarchaeales archaeon]